MGTMSDRICQISLIFGEIEGHYPLKFGDGWLAELEFLAPMWTQYQWITASWTKLTDIEWNLASFRQNQKRCFQEFCNCVFGPFHSERAGQPVRLRGPPCRHGRWQAPLGLPPPRPRGKGGGRGEEREGGKWGEGGPGIPPCPSVSKASPAPFLGRATKFWG
jgi:hypothetical protein